MRTGYGRDRGADVAGDATRGAQAALVRAGVGTTAILAPAAAFVLGGPMNLAGALVLSAIFYPIATWLASPAV